MQRGAPPPPEFLIDRALGIALADALRDRGFVVETLRSMYGEQRAQEIDDEEWIPECVELGFVLLTKDDSIRRYPPARDAALAAHARIFCLPNASLDGAHIQQRFLANLNRIVQRSRHPGPYMYAVDPDGLRLLWPR